jgi:hypothetical protein
MQLSFIAWVKGRLYGTLAVVQASVQLSFIAWVKGRLYGTLAVVQASVQLSLMVAYMEPYVVQASSHVVVLRWLIHLVRY